MKLRLLDLFSGIGGFSLGLERSGAFETVAFCEVDPFCRAVLAQHWPGVRIYDDVRLLTGDALARDGIAVDAICGGFPCQDLSFAGRRAGLEGERSGLWSEYARLIGELRPRFVVVENVPGLLSLGMGAVLGDLAALGYDAVWDCVPASAVGAPHRRDRVWIVAYANGQGEHDGAEHAEVGGSPELVADAGSQRHQPDGKPGELHGARRSAQGEGHQRERRRRAADGRGSDVADTGGTGLSASKREELRGEWRRHEGGATAERGWWLTEPDVGRVADGVPARVDRLRAMGNAVVPQIPEAWGRAIARVIGSR